MQGSDDRLSDLDFVRARWTQYAEQLNLLRESIFAHPYINRRNGVVAASYLFHQLQAVAFNRVMAPRSHHPRFYLSGEHEPMTYSLGGGNADTHYRRAFIDGGRTYRIWGKRGNSRLCTMQVGNGFTGEPPERMQVRPFPFEQIPLDADMNFELTAGPGEGSATHISLDPDCDRICITFRELFWDWNSECPTEIHIAPTGDFGGLDVLPSVDEIDDRLARCVMFMRTMFEEYGVGLIEQATASAGVNSFVVSDLLDKVGGSAGNIGTTYHQLAFALEPNDALVIEVEPSECKYWGIQASDSWFQSCEPMYHQSSLNGFQADRDLDGRYRIVLSLRDPGVGNWLDPVDNAEGFLELRIIGGAFVESPRARLVDLTKLSELLPSDTCCVAPEERSAKLRDRHAAFVRLWGY